MKRALNAVMILALIGMLPSVGLAKAKECNGTITGTVNGGIIVSAGDNCVLSGATVNGGIDMSGGTLEVCGSTINGAIQATGGDCVTLGLGPDDGDVNCPGDVINGHLSIANVNGANCPGFTPVEVQDANINGGVDLDNDGNPTQSAELESNTVQGTLMCDGNSGVTNDGFPNTVTGQEKGQCAGL